MRVRSDGGGRVSRRTLLLASTAGTAGTAGTTGLATSCSGSDEPANDRPTKPQRSATNPPTDPIAVDPYGPYQAGIALPEPPQQHAHVSVWDIDHQAAGQTITHLGELAASLCEHQHAAVRDFERSRLTVTVGIGPRLVSSIDANLPGAKDLPRFKREEYSKQAWYGDLMVQTCADDPALTSAAVAVLNAELATDSKPRWSQGATRGPARPDGSTRNLLGFVDGIITPRSRKELAENVWLSGPDAVRGGSIMVVRRMRLDVDGFLDQPVPQQEAVMGRQRASGEPLPGSRVPPEPGSQLGDELNMQAKTSDGRYIVPLTSHARRAHPSFTGSGVMLRRSYSFDNGDADSGLLFISFQSELRTFVATQQRLDDMDDLMTFATTTASGTFLILPGRSRNTELGAGLFS